MRLNRRVLLPLSLVLNLLLLAAMLVPLRLTEAQTDVRYFPETKHTVQGAFLKYWTEHGGLAQQGYPLTEEFQEVNKLDGKPYTVQYFERSIFEKHPENKPPYEVLLSQLGKFEIDARYPNNSNPAAAPVPAPGGGPAPQPTQPAPPPAAGGQQFTGHGDQATATFALRKGLVVAHSVQTGGNSNFIVELVDAGGKDVGLLANDIGPTDTSGATRVSADGQYLLKVTADGDWTISVSQPSGTYATPPATQTFQGHHSQVTAVFSLKAGAARVHAVGHGGDSNFIAFLKPLDTTGFLSDSLVANAIGEADVSTVVNVPSNRVYILEVTYDGDWTITISQ